MLKNLLLVVVCICAMLPFTANAQQRDGGALQFFTASNFYQGLLSNAFASMPPALFRRCPSLVSNGSTIKVLQPVTFGTDGSPNGGFWKQSFPVSGCGNDTIINLYFSASENEQISIILGMPGDTLSDLTLQRDAIFYAKVTASTLLKGCASLVPTNSVFVGYGLLNPATPDPGPKSLLRPWREDWTLVGCGRRIDEIVDFVPEQVGTTIIVPLGDAIATIAASSP
jgi:hypothetical protein